MNYDSADNNGTITPPLKPAMPPSLYLRHCRQRDSPDVVLQARTRQKVIVPLNLWRATVLRLHALMRSSSSTGHACACHAFRDGGELSTDCTNLTSVHISHNKRAFWLTVLTMVGDCGSHRVRTVEFERKYELPHLLNCSRKAMLEAAMLGLRKEEKQRQQTSRKRRQMTTTTTTDAKRKSNKDEPADQASLATTDA